MFKKKAKKVVEKVEEASVEETTQEVEALKVEEAPSVPSLAHQPVSTSTQHTSPVAIKDARRKLLRGEK